MLKRLITLVFVASIVGACKQSETTGLALSTTRLYDSPLAANPIGVVPAGSIIEYIDTMPIPSTSDGYFKVRVDSREGYMDPVYACFGCIAAAIKTTTEIKLDKDNTIGAEPGTFVAYDSVSGDQSHVYVVTKKFSGWASTGDLSMDPGDVAVATVAHRLESKEDDGDRFTAFASVVAQYPSNPFLQSIKVNLSEAQDQDLADLQSKFGLVFNKAEGKVIATPGIAKSWVEEYVRDLFQRQQGDDPDGYSDDQYGWVYTNPRLRYYDMYMAALPSFVNLPAKSIGFGWDRKLTAKPGKAYLLYRLDRSPENIKYLWSIYKPAITYLLEYGSVRNVSPDVKNLIEAYDRIVAMGNHRALMQEISKKVAAWDKEHLDANGVLTSMYTQVEQAELYQPLIDEQKYDIRSDGLGIWYHSFWVRRFAEGNEKVVYDILKEIVGLAPVELGNATGSDNTGGGETIDERGDAETGEDYDSRIETLSCVFEEYSVGDCGHMVFSCADFGDADVSELPEDQLEVWNKLVLSDSEGERGNPEYVGKEFIVVAGKTTGPACNEGQGGEGVIPKLFEFKLKE